MCFVDVWNTHRLEVSFWKWTILQSWDTVTYFYRDWAYNVPWFLWCRAGFTWYLVFLQQKDESGLALCRKHPGAFLRLLGPRDKHGSPPVLVLVFLLPVAEMSFGRKENVRNSEVESEGTYSPYLVWLTHFFCSKEEKIGSYILHE